MKNINKVREKLVKFEIENQTEVKVISCYYIKVKEQHFYKNGKPKGKPICNKIYYFFDNEKDHKTFLENYNNLPKSEDNLFILVARDDLFYDSDFLRKNLNKLI